MLTKIKKYINENLFITLFAAIAAFSTSMHITSEGGRAALYETLSLGLAKESLYLATLFILIKFLGGIDKNINEDLFTNPDNSTKFVSALAIGAAIVLLV